MLTDDWMLRQVDGLARSLAKLVLKKDSADYLPTGAEEDAALDALHLRLVERLAAGDVGGGEDLLFQESDWDDLRYLEVAVDFYARANTLTDGQLDQAGFDRQELQEGLQELAARYGVIL